MKSRTVKFASVGMQQKRANDRRFAALRGSWRFLAAFCGLFSVGCSPYFQAQIDLTEQSRKGVAMISQSLENQQELIQRFEQSQRLRIDNAFDADVREQETLTADWVIDHRRAYAAAIDILSDSNHRRELSHHNDRRTLAAIDLALQKLEWLSSIPMQFKGGTP